jgi:hypothetical protein
MRRSPVLGVRRRTAKAAINELERLGELVIEYEPAAAVRLRLARQGQRRHETPRPANPPRRPPRRRRSVASLPSSCARGSGAPDVRRRATDKRPGRVVIVGAGPADLTGAVYAASDGLRTLVTGLCDDCSASAKQNCECGQSACSQIVHLESLDTAACDHARISPVGWHRRGRPPRVRSTPRACPRACRGSGGRGARVRA